MGFHRKKKNKESLFVETVRKVVKKIPKGRVMSYGEVAKRAGFPSAARAVGSVMRKNFDNAVPCHRVIRSDGGIGMYNRGGTAAKIRQLQAEGIAVKKGKVVLK